MDAPLLYATPHCTHATLFKTRGVDNYLGTLFSSIIM